jgi:ubiquinone/menaquinone biosynthesis C-methylase UbiE
LKHRDVGFREILARELTGLKLRYVLDAATGGANMTKMLSSKLEASIISIDVDREVAEDIYQIVDKDKVTFVQCDLANLPFENDTFCCVICDLTLSTIENWKHYQTLKEFKRTLKPKSRLYITDYALEEPSKSVRDKLAVEAWRLYKAASHLKGSPHYEELPPNLIIQWLKDIGFQRIEYGLIETRKKLAWREGFKEYYRNMEKEIAEVEDSKARIAFQAILEELRKEIEKHGATCWSGIYLIKATA